MITDEQKKRQKKKRKEKKDQLDAVCTTTGTAARHVYTRGGELKIHFFVSENIAITDTQQNQL